MNKDEALKMAIEIFTKYRSDYFHMTFGERWEKLDNAIDLIKEALEEAEKQEWQSLNADEIDDLWDESSKDVSGSIRLGYTTKQHYFYVLIEQALKEKNKC